MFEEPTKARSRLFVFLEFEERRQFLPDESLLEPTVLPEGDPLDVDPILGTARERLEDDEIFRAAGQQGDTSGHSEGRGPTHSPLLEGHGPQGHVEGDPVQAK